MAEIFANKRTITEDDFACYFDPQEKMQDWKQHVNVRMITDGEEDEHRTPPPSPKKSQLANANVGTKEYENDPDLFPENANLEVKSEAVRSIQNFAVLRASIEQAVRLAMDVLDVVRSPLVEISRDMERRIATVLTRLALLCICTVPLRLSDVEIAGAMAAARIFENLKCKH